ncbi:MAG: DUF2089 domain-containing protein [Dehalococcoidia bacterium]
MQKLFSQCPACGGELVITECKCTNCQLQMRGEFRSGPLAALTDDEMAFTRVFLSARGNLSEVERILGISYPTIRNKLDEINNAINRIDGAAGSRQVKGNAAPDISSDAAANTRNDILQKVADGKLTPVEAVEKLRKVEGEGD